MNLEIQHLVINTAALPNSFWGHNLLCGLIGGILTALATFGAVLWTSYADRKARKYENIYKLYQEKILKLLSSIEDILAVINFYNPEKDSCELSLNVVEKNISDIVDFKKQLKDLLPYNDDFLNDSFNQKLNILYLYIQGFEVEIRSFEWALSKGGIRTDEKYGNFYVNYIPFNYFYKNANAEIVCNFNLEEFIKKLEIYQQIKDKKLCEYLINELNIFAVKIKEELDIKKWLK